MARRFSATRSTSTSRSAAFEPEVLPLAPDSNPSGELAFCEGTLPGRGFGCPAQSSKCPSATSSSTSCTGVINAGNTVRSGFESVKPYCATKPTRRTRAFEAYLTVTTVQTTASGKSYVISSEPFRLDRVTCPKAGAKSDSANTTPAKEGRRWIATDCEQFQSQPPWHSRSSRRLHLRRRRPTHRRRWLLR